MPSYTVGGGGGGLMTLSFGNMTVNLNIFNVIKEIGDDEDICEVNMI